MKVLIATPLGEGGKGGIDRIMDEVRRAHAARPAGGLNLSFGVTRGQGHIALSPLHLAAFCGRMTFSRLAGTVDVLHVNLSSDGSCARKLVIASLARRLGIPYVLHLHGSRFRQYWDRLPAGKSACVREMFEKADRVIVLGAIWKTYVRSKTSLPEERVVIVPNATPSSPERDRGHANGRRRVLFLGRVGARKGVPELVSALVALRDRSDWTAVIAGDGDTAPFAAQVAAAGLTDRVSFPGWVGPAEVRRHLLESDILVLPSHDENLPMSVIEAMAARLAVVTTPVGAVEDIIEDGVTGRLVPVGDVPALTAAIGGLLDDPAMVEALGMRAAAFHARHLDIAGYVDKLSTVWAAALRDARSGGPAH